MNDESYSPLVSICIPVYNGEKFIAKAFESISQQTYKNYELVITNDGSTDNTEQVLNQELSSFGFKGTVFTIPNRGCEGARDYACSKASGEFIAPLDIDDIWEPGYLENMIAAIQAKTDAGLIYCDFIDYDERSGERVKKSDISPWIKLEKAENYLQDAYFFKKREFLGMLFLGQVLFPSCTLFRKSLYDESGGYWKEMQLQISTDWDFGLRVSLLSGIIYLDNPLLIKLRHDSNLSGNQLKTSECDIKVIRNLLSKYELTNTEIKLAKDRLAARYYDAAYCYFMDKANSKARKYLISSFMAKPSIRSIRLILATLIPSSLIRLIKSS